MHKTTHHADGSTRLVHLGGWKKQLADHRDENFRLKLHGGFFKIASSCDNRPICSPVVDQADLGSCTANAFGALVEANEIKRIGPNYVKAIEAASAKVSVSGVTVAQDGSISFSTKVVPPHSPTPTPAPPAPPSPPAPLPPAPPAPAKLARASRLFEYYGTRKIEGTVGEDSGATIRDAIKCGALYGVADEAVWPYNTAQFAVNPPQAIWTAAASHKVTSYHAISDGDLQTMKSVLASQYLIEFGFQVYDYFLSADMAAKGLLPVPASNEQLQGGHAVALVGYDDSKAITAANGTISKGAFLVRNSWGTNWGLSGYFWMSYDYVATTTLCSDFWVIQSSPI